MSWPCCVGNARSTSAFHPGSAVGVALPDLAQVVDAMVLINSGSPIRDRDWRDQPHARIMVQSEMNSLAAARQSR
jgi:hypothetical protein